MLAKNRSQVCLELSPEVANIFNYPCLCSAASPQKLLLVPLSLLQKQPPTTQLKFVCRVQSNNRVIVGFLGYVKLFHCSRTSGIHAQIAIYGSRPFIQADLIVALLLREDSLILTEKSSEQESLLT